MKLILRIAKTELATLFYSPIAWFILIIFSFLSGMQFTKMYDGLLTGYELGWYSGYPVSLTFSLFGGDYSFFSSIQNNLYMFIPLLTMGLLSREYSTGSIKLLYSSPVTSTQIVLGKYLSMMIYGVILLSLPILCMLYSSFFIPHFDFGLALTALLGLYMLVCAYAAIGLFMSSLTSYQVVAAIATLAVLTALKYVGSIGQEYDLIKDITYWLSINGRSTQMLGGLITSEDVVYFIVVISLFIVLTVMKIKFSRSSMSTVSKILGYAGVIAIALGIGYISSRPKMMTFEDETETKSQTITQNSQEVMSQLDGKVTITHYVNLFDDQGSSYLPRNRKWGESVFNQFVRFKPDMKIKYVYYWDTIPGVDILARYKVDTLPEAVNYLANLYRLSPKWFKTPEQIRSMIDLSPFDNRFIRIIERENGQKAYLRDFSDMQRVPGEAEITAAFKKMIMTPPIVGFLNGHEERDIAKGGDRDYLLFANEPTFRYSLINQGFDVSSIDIDNDRTIPEDINIIVVADLRSPLNEQEMAHIDEYLARGGNMLILTEPERGASVNPLLSRFGIEDGKGTIAYPSKDFAPNLVLSEITPQMAQLSYGFEAMLQENKKVAMPGTAPLTYTENGEYEITPMFVTRQDNVWVELEAKDMLEDKVEFNEEAGETMGQCVTALSVTRQINDKQQRILVIGDADCISNAELKMQREGYNSGNFELVTEGFRWLTYSEFKVDTRRPSPSDHTFTTTVDSLGYTKVLFMLIYPGILLIMALAIGMIRRKH